MTKHTGAVLGIFAALLCAGCGGEEHSAVGGPATSTASPAAQTAPAAAPGAAPAPTPAPAPDTGQSSTVGAAPGATSVPASVQLARLSRSSWLDRRAGDSEWRSGMVARVIVESKFPISTLHLGLPNRAPLSTGALAVGENTEERQDIEGVWALQDLGAVPQADLALSYDHSAIAAMVKDHAVIQTVQVGGQGKAIHIGQGANLRVAWRDQDGERVLAFEVDAADPSSPTVLCMVASGLASGERAHALPLSGGHPLRAGAATSIRAVYFNVEGGFVTSKGTEGWPRQRGAPHLLGWVKPPPSADSTKPVKLQIAVLRLPLLVLRNVPVGR